MHLVLFLLSITALSQAAPLVRWAAVPPEVIGTYRMLGASVILLLWHWLFARNRTRTETSPRTGNIKWTVLAGAFFFLHLFSYFFAAQNTLIANSMILFSLNPLFTALITVIFFKEKLHPRIALAYLAGFAALYLLLRGANQTNLDYPRDWEGRLSAVFSAITYSFYILTSRKARQDQNNLTFSAKLFAVTGILFLILMLYKTPTVSETWNLPVNSWLAILGTILIPTYLGHFVFIYLLKHLDINWMSCGKMLEPAMSAATAYIFFQEKVTSSTMLAFMCTLLATVFLIFSPKEKQS